MINDAAMARSWPMSVRHLGVHENIVDLGQSPPDADGAPAFDGGDIDLPTAFG